MRLSRRTRAAAATTLLCAVALSGCGPGSGGGGKALAGDALKVCISKAKVLRDTKRNEPTLKMLGAVDMAKNRGKTVWIIDAARVPFLQRISSGAEAAAQAAGMKSKVIYGDGSTNSAQAAVRQAIAQKAAGIVLVVIDPTTIQNAVDDAKSAGIVVTDVINRSVGDTRPDGIAGDLVLDVPAEMKAMAGWIMADSKCTANTLMYSPSSLPITVTAAKLLQADYRELCATCHFELKDLDYGNFGSTLTPEVQTDVRRSPKINYIVSIVGSAVPNVDAALRDSKIKVVAHDGLEDNIQAIRKGTTHETADFAFAPSESIGWQIIDQQARLLLDDKNAVEVVIPSRLVDKGNVGSSDTDIWPGYTGYKSRFTNQWAG